MKNLLIFLAKNTLILCWVLLCGCATPSFLGWRPLKEPSPEDTIIRRRSTVAADYVASEERIVAIPLRPEPEPEEVLIVEHEAEGVKAESAAEPQGIEYMVQKGDSLYWLAKKYGIPFRELLSANGCDKSTKLSVGQKIILPGITQEQWASLTTLPLEYTVQRGDCLSKIAHKYGLKVGEIKAANGMGDDRLVAGKRIIIPEHGRYKNFQPVEKPLLPKIEKPLAIDVDGYYVIQKGDVLSKVASRAKVSVSDLQQWNHIPDPTKIRAGQRIIVKPKAISEIANIEPAFAPIPPSNIEAPKSTLPLRDEMPIKHYNFINDADFFDKIDEIPIIQVHD